MANAEIRFHYADRHGAYFILSMTNEEWKKLDNATLAKVEVQISGSLLDS